MLNINNMNKLDINSLKYKLLNLKEEIECLTAFIPAIENENISITEASIAEAVNYAINVVFCDVSDYKLVTNQVNSKFWLLGIWSPTIKPNRSTLEDFSVWLENRISETSTYIKENNLGYN